MFCEQCREEGGYEIEMTLTDCTSDTYDPRCPYGHYQYEFKAYICNRCGYVEDYIPDLFEDLT